MKSILNWESTDLILTTRTKRRVLATFKPTLDHALVTFWKNCPNGFYIGSGKSFKIPEAPLVEAYWSTVQGATFLIHYAPDTGKTAVQRDNGGPIFLCTREI